MLDLPTNLYLVVAQTLQWVHGITSLQYDILRSRIAKIEHDGETHYSFEVVTNNIRLGGIKHPMGLVIERSHMALTGVILDPIEGELYGLVPNADNIIDIEIHHMLKLLLKADNSGISNISAQTKFKSFDGGDTTLSRQFLFKNNMLFQIR
jgi:hypothetical protein